LRVQLLGPFTVSRAGAPLTLPASRKVRALLAYLLLAPGAVTRSQLCELLWDVPNDPRGELRWCLSKIRRIVDHPDHPRVEAGGDTVRLDVAGCRVDAIEIAQAMRDGIATMHPEAMRTLSGLFAGDFLDGLEIDRSPSFSVWLTGQRRTFRIWHAALLEQLVGHASDEGVFAHLEAWLRLAPFERRAHEAMLDALARHGRIREGEEHLAATTRLFEDEGLDCASIRDAWRSAKGRGGGPPTGWATTAVPATVGAWPENDGVASRRASIAVMPFVDRSTAAGARGGAADALAHDIITRLAKLRSLFVIGQGSVFALHEKCISPEAAGRMLNVDYLVSGALRRQGKHIAVMVELADMRTRRIIWADHFNDDFEDAFSILDEIGNRIVASIASEIEAAECSRAVLRPPSSLDAWGAHHRGLWHMYRFNKRDNDRARQFFEMAVRLDPSFARAHAGLSFTHFQSAFQGWERREPEIDRAFEAAERSLMADDRDPAAHLSFGRALWLRGRFDQSIVALEQAVELSPNFALGHYTLAFVHSQAGNATAAVASSDHARSLSPFDPLLFGMLGSRAMALVRLGRFDEAADWAAKAAARPNAHAHILAIAAFALALADRLVEARAQLTAIRQTLPRYQVRDFLTAMRFEPQGEKLFREGARRIGLE
jgi:DNA-binding SARP family transcriptional activator/TolB-like protein/Tfp pilus assembly protein PilF